MEIPRGLDLVSRSLELRVLVLCRSSRGVTGAGRSGWAHQRCSAKPRQDGASCHGEGREELMGAEMPAEEGIGPARNVGIKWSAWFPSSLAGQAGQRLGSGEEDCRQRDLC